MNEQPAYTMTVDLSVVESLGINLYSNAAAVLSELVANAYDADASSIDIAWKKGSDTTITIVDDGCGMTKAELNERFLVVGYKKRTKEGSHSPKWERQYMGRKGIGKLSVFSIAQLVTVYSTKNSMSSGLRINITDLQARISEGKQYHPEEIEVPDEHQNQGTVIILGRLKHKRADITANALRKRLARRFDVLDTTPPSAGGFRIKVNGDPITFEDRLELKRLEFIWEFGEQTLPDEAIPNVQERFVLPKAIVDPAKNWSITGWIGTARTPSELTEDREAGSLKNIIVLARKRPVQEGIIDKIDFSRVFGNYVTGQIEANFLDLDEEDDIATSDRQRLIEDDPRVIALIGHLRKSFNRASDEWTEHRPKQTAKADLEEFPKLKQWVNNLPSWQHRSAWKMIRNISALPLEKEHERQNRAILYRSGVLAFARIGLREMIDQLDKLSDLNPESLLELFGQQDEYEDALWTDILRSRIEAIEQFRNLTDNNEKERVLQRHLFDHLWLLDPSWERATGNKRIEEQLSRIDPDYFPEDREGNEIRGRIDIRYATAAGRHIIVELKRYSIVPTIDDLMEQGGKYYAALRDILEKQNQSGPKIEVIFVLGDKPKVRTMGKYESEEEVVTHKLEEINGRCVLYDELIENACRQYDDYFQASAKAYQLEELLQSLY